MSDNIDLAKIKSKLHNYTEDLVIDQLNELLKDKEYENICTCEKCILDICTYSLNRLSSQYVASQKGEVYTKIKDFDQQIKVDVISTVAKAIDIVGQNPHNNN